MINYKNFIGLILIILTSYSCTVYKKVKLPTQNGIQGYDGTHQTTEEQIGLANAQRLEAYQAEKTFIKNGDNLEWALAMSGGGVRSATYNLGALKALYDLGLLNKMQIISSVSGGGYLSYGLYSNYYTNKDSNKNFGFYSFDNSIFLQKVCNQQNKANFMPNVNYLGAFFNTPKGAFNIYQRKIERAYGHGTSSNLKITSLNNNIKNGSAPYFIINSTLAANKESDWLNRIVEFTPVHYGNPELGLIKWNTDNTINWSEATTTSAAALKFKLLKKIPYSGKAINTDYLALSDGGHSENLAAIGLIRRGVKNIVIIDAEHNKDYSFDGYLILKEKLKSELNLDLKIKNIDDFLKEKTINKNTVLENSVHKGTVGQIPLANSTESKLNINIYYIKMSMSQDIEKQLKNEDVITSGSDINVNIKAQTCTEYNKKETCTYFTCNKLKDFESTNLNDLASFWVQSYSTFLNNNKKWKRLGYSFPHTTTADQSFYRDQLAAFIGLGYLQASKLKGLIIE